MSTSTRRTSDPRLHTLKIRFSALFTFLLLASALAHAQSPIQLRQHSGTDAGISTTASLAFPAPNTAGNWIAVVARGGMSSSQVFTVSDSNGNVYRQAAQIGFKASAVTLAIYYAENINGGTNTVTVSDTVSAPLRLAILEYSGVAPSASLDIAATATGTSAVPDSGTVTTTANGDLLLGAVAGFSVNGISVGQILNPGASTTMNVTFAPAATGSVTGSVTITSNAANSPLTIALSGTGVTPHSASLTYTDNSVVSGQTHYYVVTAVDSSNLESAHSNQATAVIP